MIKSVKNIRKQRLNTLFLQSIPLKKNKVDSNKLAIIYNNNVKY